MSLSSHCIRHVCAKSIFIYCVHAEWYVIAYHEVVQTCKTADRPIGPTSSAFLGLRYQNTVFLSWRNANSTRCLILLISDPSEASVPSMLVGTYLTEAKLRDNDANWRTLSCHLGWVESLRYLWRYIQEMRQGFCIRGTERHGWRSAPYADQTWY